MPCSQPRCAPVSPSSMRRKSTRCWRTGTVREMRSPLTVSDTAKVSSSLTPPLPRVCAADLERAPRQHALQVQAHLGAALRAGHRLQVVGERRSRGLARLPHRAACREWPRAPCARASACPRWRSRRAARPSPRRPRSPGAKATPAMAKSPCRRASSMNTDTLSGRPHRDQRLDQQLVGLARRLVEAFEVVRRRDLAPAAACFATTNVAPSASAQAGISAAGSASAMLPPKVPRLRTATWATCGIASAISGRCSATMGELATSTWRASAPMRTLPPRSEMPVERGQPVDVDQQLGLRQSHVQRRHEALPARQDARLLAVLLEQRQRVLDAFSADVAEPRRLHALSPRASVAKSARGQLATG